MTSLLQHYKTEIVKEMKESFNYSSICEVPKISKITLNSGIGKIKESADEVKQIATDIALIAGQKPRENKSRKSISGFKLREGQIVGLSTTLRGRKMHDFIERLTSIALPRIRDFRGLSLKSFDGNGGYSIGIKEHTIFPEIKYEKSRVVFGLQIDISTSAKTNEETKKLLECFGFPFARDKSIKSKQNDTELSQNKGKE